MPSSSVSVAIDFKYSIILEYYDERIAHSFTPVLNAHGYLFRFSPVSYRMSLKASETHKAEVRARVWKQLRRVAFPDSRFHYDFSSFIADFQDSDKANARLATYPAFSDAKVLFITPDNCLEQLRLTALQEGKTVLTTTYGIRRGFWVLEPARIEASKFEFACTLDGMERQARHVSLAEIKEERIFPDLLVTGTGAISRSGVRFGKGHGFFDLEWAMLHSIGAVKVSIPCAAVVHDCQLLDDKLTPEVFDTVCDIVVTPQLLLEVETAQKPTCGVLWDRLADNMVEDISPLQELRAIS